MQGKAYARELSLDWREMLYENVSDVEYETQVRTSIYSQSSTSSFSLQKSLISYDPNLICFNQNCCPGVLQQQGITLSTITNRVVSRTVGTGSFQLKRLRSKVVLREMKTWQARRDSCRCSIACSSRTSLACDSAHFTSQVHRPPWFNCSQQCRHLLTFLFILILSNVVAGSREGVSDVLPSTAVFSSSLGVMRPAAMRPGSSRGFPTKIRIHAPSHELSDLTSGLNYTLLGRAAVRDFHIVELFGGMVAVGEYYARVKLGGQEVHVQIDTGSATLAAPLKTCKSCLEGDRRYDIEASNSGKARKISCTDSICSPDRCSPFSCGGCSPSKACCSKTEASMCGFHLNFGDGSGARGLLVEDIMSWGGVQFPVVFGGINRDSPDFERAQVDGILGMAYPSLACNPSCVKPAFESMAEHLSMRQLFQICITATSGRIVLGDYDKSIMKSEPTWVPMSLADPPSYYTLRLHGDLEVNGTPVPFPKYKLGIADSGTTLIVFTRDAFAILVQHLQDNYCNVPGLCGPLSWFRPAHCTKLVEEDRKKMPTLRFRLDGFDIVLGPEDYLIQYTGKGNDYWCVGMMALDSLSGGIDVIFGNTVMKKYVTIYDRENKRIGFGESKGDCGGSVKDDSATSPSSVNGEETSSQTNATSGSSPTNPEKSDHKPVFENAARCSSATSCRACANLSGGHCFWDTAVQQCLLGDPSRLMCAIDKVVQNVLFVIISAGLIVLLVVVSIVCCVCFRRKRQNALAEAAIDEEERIESRIPLDPARSDSRDKQQNDDGFTEF